MADDQGLQEALEILLVEDNPLDAELTMRALKTAGLVNRLLWVKDGQEALDYVFKEGQYAHRNQSAPRLVLLDVNMPRVNGVEVLRAIKADQRTRRTPVVLLTSSSEERDMAESYHLGVNSYMVKPVDFKVFADSLDDPSRYKPTMDIFIDRTQPWVHMDPGTKKLAQGLPG